MEIREEYKQIKKDFLDFFDNYEKHLAKMCESNSELNSNYTKRVAAFDYRRDQIEKNTFSVVVIGEMKHGKSTLLNAFLGKPAFPKAVQEATATISYLKHNDMAEKPEWRNHAVVTFWDKSRDPVIVEHTKLADYTTCLNKDKINVAEEVKEVSIYTDSRFVEDGVMVVDTPGTNTTVQKHADITNEQIEKSNAAIFLFKAGTPGKKSDYEFLAMAASKINRFFFVVNRIDEIGGMKNSNIAINDIVKKMKEYSGLESLGSSRFYPTSGLLALLARYGYIDNEKYEEDEWNENDSEEFRDGLIQKSGVPVFEDALLSYLFKGERMSEFFHSHKKYLSNCLKEDEMFLLERRNALNGNISLNELENRRTKLELEHNKQQEKIKMAASGLNDKLNNALQDLITEAQLEIDNKKVSFENELKEYTDFQDLEDDWEIVSAKPAKLYTFVRNECLQNLKNTIKNVFKSQDMKLRGQLNESLQQAGIVALPDISGEFIPITIRKEINPIETKGKIEELNQKKSQIEEELSSFSGSESEYERLKEEKIILQSEINRNQTMAENRLKILGERPPVQVITIPGYSEYEDREGIGWCFQWLIGKKEVRHPPRQEIDTTAREKYDEDLKKIEEWRQKKEEELNKKIEVLQGEYTEARMKNIERIEKEKLKLKLEDSLNQAKLELEEKLENARKKALSQNKKALLATLNESLQQILEDIKGATEKCSEWAEKYIADISAEVDDFCKTKGAELKALKNEINLKKEEKEKALEQLEVFEKDQHLLQEQFDKISQQISVIYK